MTLSLFDFIDIRHQTNQSSRPHIKVQLGYACPCLIFKAVMSPIKDLAFSDFVVLLTCNVAVITIWTVLRI